MENNDTPKEELVPEEIKKETPNVIQDFKTAVPLDDTNKDTPSLLALPSDTAANIREAISNMPNVDFTKTADGNNWINNLRTASIAVPQNEWFYKTVERPGSAYKQKVDSERGTLTAGAPKFNDDTNTKLTGERAVLRVRSLLGLGSIVQIPLWHSGFWISIKAPTEASLLELNRRIADEKISLGRNTYGLAFANTSVFFAGWIMDFAIQHIYNTTLKPEVESEIRKHVSTLDIPIIAWGLACVIWPKGFPYSRSVLDQTNEPNKVIREKLEVGKLLWVDNNSLTPWQISHMAMRHGNNMTKENLERYSSEFTIGKGRTIPLIEGCDITFKVPKLDDYLISGQKWVNNIIAMVDKAFSFEQNNDDRDTYIIEHGKATNMRQYAHWVESITVGNNIIDDLETLEQTIDTLSAEDSVRKEYFKSIRAFIEDATMAIVAIPVTENTDINADLPRFPHLIPIDALSVFFILLVQKTSQIQNRP